VVILVNHNQNREKTNAKSVTQRTRRSEYRVHRENQEKANAETQRATEA
jgi:hypothetical protein